MCRFAAVVDLRRIKLNILQQWHIIIAKYTDDIGQFFCDSYHIASTESYYRKLQSWVELSENNFDPWWVGLGWVAKR